MLRYSTLVGIERVKRVEVITAVVAANDADLPSSFLSFFFSGDGMLQIWIGQPCITCSRTLDGRNACCRLDTRNTQEAQFGKRREVYQETEIHVFLSNILGRWTHT